MGMYQITRRRKVKNEVMFTRHLGNRGQKDVFVLTVIEDRHFAEARR